MYLMKTWVTAMFFAVTLFIVTIADVKETEAKELNELKEGVTVQEGEVLEILAEQYGSTKELWKQANHLEKRFLIVGQQLNIVFPYQVAEGDQLNFLARKYHTSPFLIKQLNDIERDEFIAGEVISIPVNTNRPAEAEQYSVDTQMDSSENKIEVEQANEKEDKSNQKIEKENKEEGKEVSKSAGQQIQMKATAYNKEGNEQWGDLTYMGTTVRHGVVAVDPNVIPLGTKLYVSGYDTPLLPAGGFVAIAEDTGGAIKGNKIDIYIDAPTDQIYQFGIQDVQVQILE